MKACNQCGKCCKKYGNGGLTATADEVVWWQTFRPEISRYVSGGEIWMDPATGKQLSVCPWLHELPDRVGYECSIYHDRPEDCKHYPVTIDQMAEDECEMLEVRDLIDPLKAQKQLDDLMADSRPPVEP